MNLKVITIFLALLSLSLAQNLQLKIRPPIDYTVPQYCPKISFPTNIRTLQTQELKRYIPYPYRCYCSHWVYALDESGSMNGTRWNTLVDTMDDNVQSIPNTGRNFVTTFEFSTDAQNPNYYHRFPPALISPILNFDGGWTDFNDALDKAIDIINTFPNENTYFYLVTDGYSSFSDDKA